MIALDVVEDILLTQYVEDLLRWKSVCKSWYSLISSPLFVKRHLKFVRKKEDRDNKQLGNRRICEVCRVSSNIDKIEGSSNGLVCISTIDKYEICLSNPSTREFRILQQPITLPNSAREFGRCYGFGYDSSADDYKLVMAIHYKGSNDTLVHILSLKSNVWKLFGHVNYGVTFNANPGILVNGSLHWFWYKDNKQIIVCFNLAKEEFREIPQPEDRRYEENRLNCKLGIFEDHLCIIPVSDGRDIWVMKNYNVKQSWELLPTDCEMKHRVHILDEDRRLETPSYFCCDAEFYDFIEDMSNPIFVQTLVSPYVNDNERPSVAKNNKRTVKSAKHKGKRKRLMTQEIEGEGGTKQRTRNKNN